MTPSPSHCASQPCPHPPKPGSPFCAHHDEILARVRGEVSLTWRQATRRSIGKARRRAEARKALR